MNHYIAFIKIVETGSFTKAAEQLGYTQSGISQLIKNLETEVRTKLIIRSRSGVSLTPDGKELYSIIRNIVHAKNALDEAVDKLEGIERSVIKIAVVDSIVNHYLPSWIQSFKTIFPTVKFELTLGDYSEIEVMIKNNTVDFGFINPEITSDLDMVPIASDEYMVCLPNAHRFANVEYVDMLDLQNEPYILIKDGSVNPIEEHLLKHGVQPQIEYIVSEDRFAIELIKKGLGISIMPSLIIPASENHIISKPLSIPKKRALHLAYKDFKILPIAARKFIEHINKQK